MHHKCYTRSTNNNILSDDFYCPKCVHLAVTRYNPFRLACTSLSDIENSEVDDTIIKVDQILNNCVSYNVKEFNKVGVLIICHIFLSRQ